MTSMLDIETLGHSEGQGSLVGCRSCGCRELDTTWCLFPGGSAGKESACSAGDLGLISESGRSPGEGNGNPLQYSCLRNLMDREVWVVTVQGTAEESDVT